MPFFDGGVGTPASSSSESAGALAGAEDLAAAIAQFEERLGVRALPGGRHEALGSHNAILPLPGSTYVELIALDPTNPTPAMPPPFGLAELSEARLVTWAVRSRDIDADTARSRRRGYDPGLTVPVSRTTPEGARLDWRLTVRPEPFGDGLVPFVIDWAATPHPSRPDEGGIERCTLQSFEGVHPEPPVVADALRALQADLGVQEGDAPRLQATLAGPAGTLDLR